MKLVKAFLLGSAAGFVAIGSAQSTDLRPVQSVKICTLYGDGFYYIPGTDTCLRIAGNAQFDIGWNLANGFGQPTYGGLAGTQTRDTSATQWRARGDLDFDTRTQTLYGTLRSFTRFRVDQVDGQPGDNATTPALPRAFIQWAGWTFGRVKSFSDVPAFGDDGARTIHQTQNHPDTTESGNVEVAYTWELGSGMALHVGAGERRTKPVTNLSTAAWSGTANPTSSIAGQAAPNPFVAFKVSQAWGRWDTSLMANNIRATYYTATTPGFAACTGANVGTTLCDHPSDDWGWAVASGLIINTPWIAAGDIFGAYGSYSVGAGAYATGNFFTSPGLYASGNNVAVGPLTDAVYLNGSGFELTTSWTAGVYFTHYWTPQFTTTVFANHSGVEYNDKIVNGRWFCGASASNNFLAAAQSLAVPGTSACDPSWGYSTIGTHTDWYPVPSFRLGIEVMYNRVDTAFSETKITLLQDGKRPAGAYTARDQGITSVVFRAAREWPAGGG